jgi:hypothetical protein
MVYEAIQSAANERGIGFWNSIRRLMSTPRHNTFPQRSLKAFLDVVRHAIRMFWDGTVAGISFAFAFPSYGEDFTAPYDYSCCF